MASLYLAWIYSFFTLKHSSCSITTGPTRHSFFCLYCLSCRNTLIFSYEKKILVKKTCPGKNSQIIPEELHDVNEGFNFFLNKKNITFCSCNFYPHHYFITKCSVAAESTDVYLPTGCTFGWMEDSTSSHSAVLARVLLFQNCLIMLSHLVWGWLKGCFFT